MLEGDWEMTIAECNVGDFRQQMALLDSNRKVVLVTSDKEFLFPSKEEDLSKLKFRYVIDWVMPRQGCNFQGKCAGQLSYAEELF